MRKFITAAAIIWSLVLSACGEEPPEQQALAPPPTVTLVAVAQKKMTPLSHIQWPRRGGGHRRTARPVEGFVEKRLFDEGAEVKAGDLLIVLEKVPYEAQIGKIKGQNTGAEGRLRLSG
jgi:multidrug efflux pump subunit AcrA (membrane-fusion protein)